MGEFLGVISLIALILWLSSKKSSRKQATNKSFEQNTEKTFSDIATKKTNQYHDNIEEAIDPAREFINHCWCCNYDTNSNFDKRCTVCGWLVCSRCGCCKKGCIGQESNENSPQHRKNYPEENTSDANNENWLLEYKPQSISDLTKHTASPRVADAGPPERTPEFWKETKALGRNASGERNIGSQTGYSQQYDFPIISKRSRRK